MAFPELRDEWALRFVRELPALNQFVSGEQGFRRLLETRTDREVLWRDLRIHVEAYAATKETATLVFNHGYGAYSALYAPLLATLACHGFRVLAIDRPGHGLSPGRRGDCTVAELAEITQRVVGRLATTEPVAIVESSVGGILTSCLIPRLSTLAAGFVCHGVYDPAHRRARLGNALMRIADVVPSARLPLRLLPRRLRDGISTHAVAREWFRPGSDPLTTFDQTWRSVLSMTIAYKPPFLLDDVSTKVLILSGTDDQLLSAAATTRFIAQFGARPPRVETIPGGHLLFHEQPQATLNAVTAWLTGLPER